MKLTCDRKALADAFGLVSGVVPAQSAKPILQNVLMRADKDGIELAATDLEVSARFRITDVEVEEEGAVVLPAARAQGILRESLEERIGLECGDRIATFQAGKGVFKIVVEDPEEFPRMDPFPEEGSFSLNASDFRRMVRQTTFATAKEKTRYALNGVLLQSGGGSSGRGLSMVATDGRRLALCTAEADGKVDAPDAIIPVKGLTTVEKMLTEDDESVEMALSSGSLAARTSRGMVTSRLVDGHFPDYEAVLPSGGKLKATMDREALLHRVKQAALITTEGRRAVRLRFEDKALTMTAQAQDVGEARVELAVPDLTGADGPMEVAFNPEYLTDVLRVLPEETLVFELSDQDSPGLIRSGPNFTYVIMPVSLE